MKNAMKNTLKKYIALLLSLLLVFSCLPAQAQAEEQKQEQEQQQEQEQEPYLSFPDVPMSAWYFGAVEFGLSRGWFVGTSDTTFSPSEPMTRAMFVTVLGKRAGIDAALYSSSRFADVPQSSYYSPYVEWAARYQIVMGVGTAVFSPHDGITREQLATFLYRYAAATENDLWYNSDIFYSYSDSNEVSYWAEEAMMWAVNKNILKGSDGKLLPKNTATRAEVAQVLMSCENVLTRSEIKTEPVMPDLSHTWARVATPTYVYSKPGEGKTSKLLSAGTIVSVKPTDDFFWYTLHTDDGEAGCLYGEDIFAYSDSWTLSKKSLSQEAIAEKIEALKKKFPQGSYWNHMGNKIPSGTQTPYSVTSTPCRHSVYGMSYCNRYGGSFLKWRPQYNSLQQCLGFAALLSDEIFGVDAPIYSFTDYNELRVGDHIRLTSSVHSMVVVEKTEKGVIVAEANRNYENCQIFWTRELSRTYFEITHRGEVTYISRYPRL